MAFPSNTSPISFADINSENGDPVGTQCDLAQAGFDYDGNPIGTEYQICELYINGCVLVNNPPNIYYLGIHNSTEIMFTINDNNSISDSFRVYKDDYDIYSQTWTLDGTISRTAQTTVYTLTGFTPGTTYTFDVKAQAFFDAAYSADSNIITLNVTMDDGVFWMGTISAQTTSAISCSTANAGRPWYTNSRTLKIGMYLYSNISLSSIVTGDPGWYTISNIDEAGPWISVYKNTSGMITQIQAC